MVMFCSSCSWAAMVTGADEVWKSVLAKSWICTDPILDPGKSISLGVSVGAALIPLIWVMQHNPRGLSLVGTT